MALEWYEWECPWCRRIGQVNPAKDYRNGDMIRMSCPACGHEVIVLCDYQPTFVAYLPENYEAVDYLCDMCANDCDERREIRVGQGAYDVCERWEEVRDEGTA